MQKKYLIVVIVLVAIGIFLLSKVFAGDFIISQELSIGSWSLRWYGLCMALAVIVGYMIAQQRRPRFNLSTQNADLILFWVAISGFLGARAYHIISDFNYYRSNIFEVFQVWHGGLSIYGALIGGFIGLMILVAKQYSKSERLRSLGSILDWLVPSVLAGQIIGRFGNFFNYELFGYPTNLPWKMFVPEQFRSPGFFVQEYFHPLFLYEALANGLILLFLYKFVDRSARPGRLFLWYVLLYNTVRFLLEFLRIDSVFWGTFRANAGVSAILVLITGTLLVILYAHKTSQNN